MRSSGNWSRSARSPWRKTIPLFPWWAMKSFKRLICWKNYLKPCPACRCVWWATAVVSTMCLYSCLRTTRSRPFNCWIRGCSDWN